MDAARFWRHLVAHLHPARKLLDAAALARIEAEIVAVEREHAGEIRIAVETALTPAQLWAGLTPRARALQLFATLGMWDTAGNNGVLIYVLLADRSVEFIADRGIAQHIPAAEWTVLVRAVEARFAAAEPVEACCQAVRGVAQQLARHFPSAGGDRDELPNQPVLL